MEYPPNVDVLAQQAKESRDRGDYETAADLYGQLAHTHRALGNVANFLESFRDQGACLVHLNDVQSVVERYLAADTFVREQGRPSDLARCLMNQAIHLRQLGRHEDALKLYAEAVPLHRTHRSADALARCLMNQAICFRQLGRYEEALTVYEEAVPLHRNHRSADALARCLMNQAICLRQLGRHEEALAVYEEAVPLYQAHRLPGDLARCLMNQAICLEFLGRREEALALHMEATQLLHNEGPKFDATRRILFVSLGELYEVMEDYDAAHGWIVEAAELADRISSRLEDPTHRVLARSQLTNTFRLATRISIAREDSRDAFAYAQRGKGRTLTELLEAREDLSALDREELVLTQQHESGQIDAAAFNAGLQEIQNQRVTRQEALLGTDPRQPMPLAAIAASLQPGEALLDVIQVDIGGRLISFLVLPGTAGLVWVGAVDGVALTELVTTWEQARASWVEAATLLGNEEQRLKADRLVADLEVQQQKAAVAEQRLLAELGNLLLGDILPVLEEHGVTTLIISPDGLLHRLPLAALRIPDGRGAIQYLIERMAVQLVPTASSLAILRKPDAIRITWPPGLLAAAPFGVEASDGDSTGGLKASRSLVLRDLVQESEPPPFLPASRNEVAAIAGILKQLAGGAHMPVTLYTEEATRTRVLEHLPTAKILHLSTHGGHLRGDDDTLLEYRILLAEKTQVTVSEVYDGTVSLKDVFAVCLSACHLGEVVLQGAEAIGFCQAFLQAGAGVILAPIWAVEDSATAHLMEAWYRHLASDARPNIAEAWQQAALSHIAITDYQHPYFWAGFLPSGDGALRLGIPA